jgi:protein-L-isoaspartate O-methyltransferase
MPDPARLRDRMVLGQLARCGIRDRGLLDAMRKSRASASRKPEEFAYEDGTLPIANEQSISQR